MNAYLSLLITTASILRSTTAKIVSDRITTNTVSPNSQIVSIVGFSSLRHYLAMVVSNQIRVPSATWPYRTQLACKSS